MSVHETKQVKKKQTFILLETCKKVKCIYNIDIKNKDLLSLTVFENLQFVFTYDIVLLNKMLLDLCKVTRK